MCIQGVFNAPFLLSSNILILCHKGAHIIIAVQVLAEERKKQSAEDDEVRSRELCGLKEDEMMESGSEQTRPVPTRISC